MENEKMSEANLAVTKSANNFTIDFHKQIAGENNGNLVSSALSAHIVLSMAASGAKGSTAEQMQKTLHLPEDQKLTHQGFSECLDVLNNVSNVTLKVANKIYTSIRHDVKEDYKELVKKHFYSDCESIDFSKNVEASNTVNKWCAEKTNDKIKEIIKPVDVGSSTAMVLLNAVYFKGLWKHKFDVESTKDKPFHLNKTTTISVPTMRIQKKFYYNELPEVDAQVIALPYENEDVKLVIIVPNEIDGLQKLENNLEKLELDYQEMSQRKMEVILELPKFKIETTIELKDHLDKLGMSKMFSNEADFSGMSGAPLKVDKVIQKAFIEVNEEGTEAAAVTAMCILLCSMPRPPRKVLINRPFLYKIVHKNTILFSGHVVNPTKA